jgi:hypothetical protein
MEFARTGIELYQPTDKSYSYIGDTLKYFFDYASIDLYSDDVRINFMDFLPMLKQRYTFRETLEGLLLLYITINTLKVTLSIIDIHPDGLMKVAFSSDISAINYIEMDFFIYITF